VRINIGGGHGVILVQTGGRLPGGQPAIEVDE